MSWLYGPLPAAAEAGGGISAADGASAGIGAAAAVGKAIATAAGASAGAGSATAVAKAIATAIGASAGNGAATGDLEAYSTTAGAAAGSASAGATGADAAAPAVGLGNWYANAILLAQAQAQGAAERLWLADERLKPARQRKKEAAKRRATRVVQAVGRAAGTSTARGVGEAVRIAAARGFSYAAHRVTAQANRVCAAAGVSRVRRRRKAMRGDCELAPRAYAEILDIGRRAVADAVHCQARMRKNNRAAALLLMR